MKAFIKETFVFDQKLFRYGQPYKIEKENDTIYGLFKSVEHNGTIVKFITLDGEMACGITDYMNGIINITGPLTITFDECSIKIEDLNPNCQSIKPDYQAIKRDPGTIAREWADREQERNDSAFDKIINQMDQDRDKDKPEDTLLKYYWERINDTELDEINGYPHRFRVPDDAKIGDVVPDPNEVTCTTVTGGTIGGIPFGKISVESNTTNDIMINPNPGNIYNTPTMEEREKFFTDVPEEEKNEKKVQ